MSFNDLMTRLFKEYLDSFVIFIIDDILVYSKSDNEKLGHLRVVLQVLKEHQLIAKYTMCEFCLD